MDVLNFAQNPKKQNRFTLVIFMVSQLVLVENCFAGPPLVIDDPGILEPGTWEVILGYSVEDRSECKITQAPSLDASLGISSNSQLSFVLPRTVVDSGQGATESGLGLASVGYKWRIASTPGWEWAIAANYDFLITHDLYRSKGPDDIRVLGLPLLVSHSKAEWTWYGQAGWHKVSDGTQFWDYGVALSHPLGKSAQVMAEVYGYADSSFDSHEMNYQLGLDIEINPSLHLLTSAGSRIKSGLDAINRLDYNFFIGLQWFSDSQ